MFPSRLKSWILGAMFSNRPTNRNSLTTAGGWAKDRSQCV